MKGMCEEGGLVKYSVEMLSAKANNFLWNEFETNRNDQ